MADQTVTGLQHLIAQPVANHFITAADGQYRQPITGTQPRIGNGFSYHARARWNNDLGDACTAGIRSEEHTSELQSRGHLVCRLLLEKKKNNPSHEAKTSMT